MIQKLPLVATDASVFALAAELGWSAAWLNRRAAPAPVSGTSGAGDIAVLLNQHGVPPVPPPAPVASPGPALAGPAPVPAPVAAQVAHPVMVTQPPRSS